jgi:hypothetical protein
MKPSDIIISPLTQADGKIKNRPVVKLSVNVTIYARLQNRA